MSYLAWTAEEYAEYVRLGSPTGWAPVRLLWKPIPPAVLANAEPARVTRVTTGRCHRTLHRDPAWGGRALTGTEARWYREHAELYWHIDVHPTLTLHGGIRYVADFCAWTLEPMPQAYLVDCKGSEELAVETEIGRIAALCRDHPLGPLHILWWDKKKKSWQTKAER